MIYFVLEAFTRDRVDPLRVTTVVRCYSLTPYILAHACFPAKDHLEARLLITAASKSVPRLFKDIIRDQRLIREEDINYDSHIFAPGHKISYFIRKERLHTASKN